MRSYASSGNADPTPAPVSTETSCPALISSSAPAGVRATRYSSDLISLATPILMPREKLATSGSGGVDQGQRHLDHPLQVGDGDPLVRRVDVDHPVREVHPLETA